MRQGALKKARTFSKVPLKKYRGGTVNPVYIQTVGVFADSEHLYQFLSSLNRTYTDWSLR